MSDYSIDLTAQGTNAPWTVPSPLLKLGSAVKTAATGLKVNSNGTEAWILHNVAYGSLILSEVKGTYAASSDNVHAVVLARSGGNVGAGYGLQITPTAISWLKFTGTGSYSVLDGNNASKGGLTLIATDVVGFSYDKSNGHMHAYINGTEQFPSGGTFAGVDVVDTTYQAESTLAPGGGVSAGNSNAEALLSIAGTGVASSSPVVSAPTPSGTIGTSTTATIGCTTDTTSGNLYIVVDTVANVSGITGTQVKAGQNKNSAAATKSGSSAVSTTTPSVGVTGLTASTTYGYAIVQNSTSDSNVLTGSFTTAATTRSVTAQFVNASNAALASTAMHFWTRTSISAAATDGGSGGLSGTTDGAGSITLTGLTIAAGSGRLTYQVGSDPLNVHDVPATYA